MRGVALRLEDLLLKLSPLVLQDALARQIVAALDVLLNKQVGQTGDFAVESGNFCAKR